MTTCFETFPFPKPTDEQRGAIAAAAKELDELRNSWLNPPEWTRTEVLEFPGSVDGPWKRYIDDADRSVEFIPRESGDDEASQSRGVNSTLRKGIGSVHYPRIVPRDEDCAKQLKKRTLTNLYNERPTWLDLAHRKIDEAVFAAYGWDSDISDDELLAKLLELNMERA